MEALVNLFIEVYLEDTESKHELDMHWICEAWEDWGS